MIVVMSFTDPYTRAQIRTGMANVTIPIGSVVSVTSQAAVLAIDTVTDSELDLISDLTVDGFTTVAEVGTFLTSLPVGINSRLREFSYL